MSLRFLLQIDQPKVPAAATDYIVSKQEQMMHKLRVRHNASNLGAGMTRNALLDAAAAHYVIFFDDDVEPSAGCIDAYVHAARQHPDAAGFAGQVCSASDALYRHDGLLHCCSSNHIHAACTCIKLASLRQLHVTVLKEDAQKITDTFPV